MILPDVNVLVHAQREDSPDHPRCRAWLEGVLAGDEAFGLSDLVLSGTVRILTHPRVFDPPTEIDTALRFVELIRSAPCCAPIEPGSRHWGIFVRLCREARARGNLVPDAYLAALAIESGSLWITLDRDYGRFEGLRWGSP